MNKIIQDYRCFTHEDSIDKIKGELIFRLIR